MQRTAASRGGKGVLALPLLLGAQKGGLRELPLRVGCGQWAEGAAPQCAQLAHRAQELSSHCSQWKILFSIRIRR